MYIQYFRAQTKEELIQILNLQQENLMAKIPCEKQASDGFVSAEHNSDLLFKMNAVCPHIIAKLDAKVIGYALCMHPQFEMEIELLKPMFGQIKSVLNEGTSYMAMGKICIDKAFRKKGIFRGIYNYYKSQLSADYNCLITEVASNNLRSVNAHEHIGLETIKKYKADNISWELIKWDWLSN